MMRSTVTRTLSEIAATSAKAARDAGCPWGLAEEAGIAVRLLEAHELPGVEALARLVDTPRDCACSGWNGSAACGVAALARLSDRARVVADGDVMSFAHVTSPILLAGPLLLAARSLGSAFELAWPGAQIVATPIGVAVLLQPVGWPDMAQEVRVSRGMADVAVTPPEVCARQVLAESWERLQALADRTMVPETATSRARGAGPASGD